MNKSTWSRYFENKSCQQIEETRKRLVLRFSSYVGGLIILMFAYKNFHLNNLFVSSLLSFSGVVVLLNAVTSHFFRSIIPFCYSGSCAIFILIMGLIISGGHENTALYWVIPFPIIFFVLLGPSKGLIFNLVVFTTAFIVLSATDWVIASYRPAEVSRFLAAFFITTLLSFIAELFRFRSHAVLKSLNKESQKLVLINDMTKLLNRRFLDSVFIPQLHEQGDSLLPVGVVLADIDHFKSVNDQYGHGEGDEVIKFIAAKLKDSFRASDAVIRYGGEEFLILLPKTNLEQSILAATKVHNIINSQQYKSEVIVDRKITLSFGVANCNQCDDIDETIKKADICLYKAKKNGRNQVVSE